MHSQFAGTDATLLESASPDEALFRAAAEAEHLHQAWHDAAESENWAAEEFLCGASLPWLERIADTPAATVEGACSNSGFLMMKCSPGHLSANCRC